MLIFSKLKTSIVYFAVVFYFINPSFAINKESDELPPTPIERNWRISSTGYGVGWGFYNKEWYMSTIDYRNPEKYSIIFSPNISDEARHKFQNNFDNILEGAKKYANGLKSGIEDDYGFNPQSIKPPLLIANDEELLKLMSSKSGLIWTGAGISLISGIDTLESLYKKLGLEIVPYTHNVTEKSLRNLKIEEKKEELLDFLFSLYEAEKLVIKPSAAHFAIKDLLELTKSHYITSNLDHIENQVGYSETVIFYSGTETDDDGSETEAVEATLKIIDPQDTLKDLKSLEDFNPAWILIVGLRIDDFGIAAWAESKGIPIYFVNPNTPEMINIHELSSDKETEPDKKIKPRFLNINWLKEDAQTYLPELLYRLQELKKIEEIEKKD